MTTVEAKIRYGTSLAEAATQSFDGESVVVVRAYDERFSGIEAMA